MLQLLPRKYAIAMALTACQLYAGWVLAQGNLDTITVTGSDDEVPQRTGDVEHSEFTGSYTRVDSEQLKRRDVTLGQVIAQETGVQLRQLGGFGTFSSITIRAASEAQTNVYLDGILLNAGGNAVIDLSMLELFNLGSIDIYRGFTPLQLGNAGIGGAINLKTVPVNREPATSYLLGLGSFGTERFQLSHNRRWNDWQFVAGLSYQQSDNDFSFLNDQSTPFNPLDDRSENRNNADVKRLSGLFRAGYEWSDTRQSEWLLQTTHRAQGVPEIRNNPNNQASFDSDAWRFQWKEVIDDIAGWNTQHSLYTHNDDDHFNDQLGQVGLGSQDTRSESEVYGIKTYWEWVSDIQTTGFSADLRRENFRAIDEIDPLENRDATRDSLNLVLQHHRFFNDGQVLISPAVRVQSSSNEFTGARDNNAVAETETILSPQLGLMYEFTPAVTLKANVGSFYREPTFSELFGGTGLLLANSNLKPENGINADIGVAWTLRKGFDINATLFGSLRDELIATVYDARGVGRAINTGEARIRGIEIGSDWAYSENWQSTVNFTYQDAQNINNFQAFDGKQLPGQAQQSLYGKIQYRSGPWRIFLEGTGLWNRFYDQANILPAKDQWLQNLGLEWNKTSWRVNATVTNIGDQQVEDYNGFPRPGRALTLSVSHQL